MKSAKLVSVLLLATLIFLIAAVVDILAIKDETKLEYVQEVIRLVNAEREKVGLAPLIENLALAEPANLRAKEADQHWAHERPDGSAWSTAFVEFDFTEAYRGENLAFGQRTPAKVMAAWMKSPGHRKNILNPRFTNIAIGMYDSGKALYWSQLFFDNTSVAEGTVSASGYGPGGTLVASAADQPAQGDAQSGDMQPAQSDDAQQQPSSDEAPQTKPSDAQQVQPSDAQRVRLEGARLYLRKKASSKSDQIKVINDGTEMSVLETARGWMRVRLDDGSEGWLSDKYLVQI